MPGTVGHNGHREGPADIDREEKEHGKTTDEIKIIERQILATELMNCSIQAKENTKSKDAFLGFKRAELKKKILVFVDQSAMRHREGI